MRIDPQGHVPIYLQIADGLRASVACGAYRTGEMLPSVRVLAVELQVNPNTVQRAYEELERDGLIETRRGVGMFVSPRGKQAARIRAEADVAETFSLGIRRAREADMSDERIHGLFERILERIERETRTT